MKKFLLLAALISVLYGCENLSTQNRVTLPVHQENVLAQESFYLNNSGIAYLLDILSQNIKSNAVRSYESGNYCSYSFTKYTVI